MKVYVVLRKIEDGYNYDYCGVAASEEKAREILQDVIDEFYDDDDDQLHSFEQQDYDNYWIYIIDGVQFEIWEEMI